MSLTRDAFLDVVRQTPLVSIDLVVSNDRGEVLLGHRNNEPAKGYWFVPGGRIQKDERIDEAFSRIVQCEIGIRRSRVSAKLIGAFEHMYDSNFAEVEGINTHYVVLAHHLIIPRDTIIKPDAQHDELRWWPIAQAIDSDNVHEYSRDYLGLINVPRAMVAG